MPKKLPKNVQKALDEFIQSFITHVTGTRSINSQNSFEILKKYFSTHGSEEIKYVFSANVSDLKIIEVLYTKKMLSPTQSKQYIQHRSDLLFLKEVTSGRLHTLSTRLGLRGVREQLVNEFKIHGLSVQTHRLLNGIKEAINTNKRQIERTTLHDLNRAKIKAQQSGSILDILAQRHLEGRHGRPK